MKRTGGELIVEALKANGVERVSCVPGESYLAVLDALKDSGIGVGLPFDRALIDRAEQEIKRQYLSRSLYGAEVVTTVTPDGKELMTSL